MPLRWPTHSQLHRLRPVFKRNALHYSTVAAQRTKTVMVPCRSNGSITVDIHHPLNSPQPHPIIIYLPPGPLPPNHASKSSDSAQEALSHEQSIISTLSASAGATLVRVNYRLDARNQFPTPIHDVLAGYDWVLRYLAPYTTPRSRDGRYSTGSARLGVYGRHIGGGLAAMLACTECRLGESRIAAASIGEGVLDWVNIGEEEKEEREEGFEKWSEGDESDWASLLGRPLWTREEELAEREYKALTHNKQAKDGTGGLSMLDLVKARATLFRKPQNHFDPFASPLLFLRTPGIDPPYDGPINPLLYPSSTEPELDEDPEPPPPVKKRKTALRYPPMNSGLRLPSFDISTPANSVLFEQNAELFKYLTRAWIRMLCQVAGNSLHDLEDEDRLKEMAGIDQVAEAERRVRFRILDEDALAGREGRELAASAAEVERVGLWMERVLREN